MGELTYEERWKRDGKRWRYIYLLEEELKKRRTRQSFIRISLALNVTLLAAVFWLLV